MRQLREPRIGLVEKSKIEPTIPNEKTVEENVIATFKRIQHGSPHYQMRLNLLEVRFLLRLCFLFLFLCLALLDA